MHNDDFWVHLDTETNGINAPIFVVDIAAQKMRGWEPYGSPIRFCINHNVDIPPEASRVNGYTREILERDGQKPLTAYRKLREYIGDLPVCSYNLKFDWDRVLKKEWERLGIPAIGRKGFCLLELTRRVIDPIPAGNYKLQTLRQYYRLPERAAHSALGDVNTVNDLISSVLREKVEHLGVSGFKNVSNLCEQEWYPSKLAFGKFKGRCYQDAVDNNELRKWLEWLASSSNSKSSKMGKWYISQLEVSSLQKRQSSVPSLKAIPKSGSNEAVVYLQAETENLKTQIELSKERVIELESELTETFNNINVIDSKLYALLRDEYKLIDELKLLVEHREQYIEKLLSEGEEAAEQTLEEFNEKTGQHNQDYEEADAFCSVQKSLCNEEKQELRKLFKKLMRLFHPDRFAGNEDAYRSYTVLSQLINEAKQESNLSLLKEIANNPEKFIRDNGLESLDLSDESDFDKLVKLHQSLQIRILELIEQLDGLKDASSFKLYLQTLTEPEHIERVALKKKLMLNDEVEELERRASELKTQIEELEGGVEE